MNRKPITPKTKVAELLNDYPELENDLIAISSEFSRLKNPVLRKTVAKVATLEQAARMAGLPVGEVVNKLRSLAGLDNLDVSPTSQAGSDDFDINPEMIQEVFDARPIIETGGHPMHEVIELMNKLENGKVLELITPFVPMPLIDIGKNRGLKVKTEQVSADLMKTYYLREL